MSELCQSIKLKHQLEMAEYLQAKQLTEAPVSGKFGRSAPHAEQKAASVLNMGNASMMIDSLFQNSRSIYIQRFAKKRSEMEEKLWK